METLGDLRGNTLIAAQFGEGATIGNEILGGGGYDNLDSNVRGVLVNTRNDRGAVKAIGLGDDEHVETGPSRKLEHWVIFIRDGQKGAILGRSKYSPIYGP
jgi:hypothetical protein